MIRRKLLVEFKDAFEEEPLTIKDYLDGISQSTLLSVASHFLGFSNSKSKFENYTDFLGMLFRAENNALANQINNKLIKLERESGAELSILNVQSNLKLFEYCFDNISQLETQSESEIEINILKAYLLLNQQATEKDNIVSDSTEHLNELKLAGLSIAQSFAYSDIQNFNLHEVFVCQMIKSIYLFEFLGSNQFTQPILKAFLSYYECTNWKEYLHRFLPLVFSAIQNEREGHLDIIVDKDENYESNCRFIEKLVVANDTEETLTDTDFRKIRNTPFYKISEGIYRIIFNLFLIEKLYKGLYFKLSEINNTLNLGLKIKNFRGLFCDEFSEKYMVYRTLNSIFQNRFVEFSGAEILSQGINSEPDYYIRKENNLFLFESKDILINAEAKTSYNYNLIEFEFKKKLYFDDSSGRIEKKAVLQLIKNVERALLKQFNFDTDYSENSLKIFPIIVLHDRQYNLAGLNNLVNSWFQIELVKLKEKGLNIDNVKPITIIDIDTFVLHQDLFRDEILLLEQVLEGYFQLMTIGKNERFQNIEHFQFRHQLTVLPFSNFLSNVIAENNLFRVPALLREKGLSLF